MWKLNLLPQEVKFFELFEESSGNVVEGARLLLDLVERFENVADKVKKLFACEHHGDKITQRILTELGQTFVTPMDREDIQALAQALDNVIDLIEEAGDHLALYHIAQPTPDLVEQVRVLLQATEGLHGLIRNLPNMRNPESFKEHIFRLHEIENEGDRLARQQLSRLFQNGCDAVDIIKWKDIYSRVENAIDMCKEATDVVQTIVLKHA